MWLTITFHFPTISDLVVDNMRIHMERFPHTSFFWQALTAHHKAA
jgi:hypothetical protein